MKTFLFLMFVIVSSFSIISCGPFYASIFVSDKPPGEEPDIAEMPEQERSCVKETCFLESPDKKFYTITCSSGVTYIVNCPNSNCDVEICETGRCVPVVEYVFEPKPSKKDDQIEIEEQQDGDKSPEEIVETEPDETNTEKEAPADQEVDDEPEKTIPEPPPIAKGELIVEVVGISELPVEIDFRLMDFGKNEFLEASYSSNESNLFPVGVYGVFFDNDRVECSEEKFEISKNTLKRVQCDINEGMLNIDCKDGKGDLVEKMVTIRRNDGNPLQERFSSREPIMLLPGEYGVIIDDSYPRVEKMVTILKGKKTLFRCGNYGRLLGPRQDDEGNPYKGKLIVKNTREGWKMNIQPGVPTDVPVGSYDIEVTGQCADELTDIVVKLHKTTEIPSIGKCCRLLVEEDNILKKGSKILIKRGKFERHGFVGREVFLPCDMEVDVIINNREALDIKIATGIVVLTSGDFN